MRHHRVGLTRALTRQGWDPATIDPWIDQVHAHAIDGSPLPDDTDARLAAMIAYALTLTRTPAALRREDLAPLRAAGLDDTALLELNQVVAYFAYVNRVVDGLGVELESFHTDPTD